MGKRKERIQDIPNDLMPPPPSQEEHESDDTVMNISPDEPTTSVEANLAATSKILNSNYNSDTEDDNEDEDILSLQNANLIEIGE